MECLHRLEALGGSGEGFVAVGDFNGDTIPDLAVTGRGASSVSILLGNGDGTFASARSFAVEGYPTSVTVEDFNGDEIQDLAVCAGGNDIFAPNPILIFLGNGDGTFRSVQTLAAANWSRFITVGDFNGDSIPDLAVANTGFRSPFTGVGSSISVLLGTGEGTFRAPQLVEVGYMPVSIAVADFNGDKAPDLVVANYESNNVSVLLGTGDGVFGPPRNFSVGRNPSSVTVGDFNGDKIPDLAVANRDLNNIDILLGTGDGAFALAQTWGVGRHPESITVGDFDGDEIPDLAVANGGSGSVSILLGIGPAMFRSAQEFGVGHNPHSLVIGDFNQDKIPDLAVVNTGWNDVSILLGNGDGAFGPADYFGVGIGRGPGSITVGDFNGDAILDLAVTNAVSDDVSILLGNGDGTFRSAQNFPVGMYPGSVVVGDFNGDEIQDLAVLNTGDGSSPPSRGTVSILINTTPPERLKTNFIGRSY